MLVIDGSLGEGGGQILRTSLVFQTIVYPLLLGATTSSTVHPVERLARAAHDDARAHVFGGIRKCGRPERSVAETHGRAREAAGFFANVDDRRLEPRDVPVGLQGRIVSDRDAFRDAE